MDSKSEPGGCRSIGRLVIHEKRPFGPETVPLGKQAEHARVGLGQPLPARNNLSVEVAEDLESADMVVELGRHIGEHIESVSLCRQLLYQLCRVAEFVEQVHEPVQFGGSLLRAKSTLGRDRLHDFAPGCGTEVVALPPLGKRPVALQKRKFGYFGAVTVVVASYHDSAEVENHVLYLFHTSRFETQR